MPLVAAPALPVLAVARTGLRRVALVVLDRLGRVRCARTLDLRRRPDVTSRLAAVRTAIRRLLHREHVAVLVLEAETSRSRAPAGFRDLIRNVCDEEAVWLQERPVGGGTPTTIVSGDSPLPNSLQVDSTYVYWLSSSSGGGTQTIKRTPK